MARKKENPIRKTTGKGGNYRKTKAGAGMTKKGVAAYRKANPAQSSKPQLQEKLSRAVKTPSVVSHFVHAPQAK